MAVSYINLVIKVLMVIILLTPVAAVVPSLDLKLSRLTFSVGYLYGNCTPFIHDSWHQTKPSTIETNIKSKQPVSK